MTPRFSFVVFDMDGVLVDSEPLHEEATKAYLAELGISLDVTDLTKSMYGRRVTDLTTELARMINRPAAEVNAGRQRLFWDSLDGLQLMPGAAEAVDDLSSVGARLAVATSATRPYLEYVLQRFDLTARFDALVCGDEVRDSKPDQAIYLLAARRLGANPALCAAVEDSPNGVASARAAGMHVVAVPNEATAGLDLPGAHKTVNGLSEAVDHVLDR